MADKKQDLELNEEELALINTGIIKTHENNEDLDESDEDFDDEECDADSDDKNANIRRQADIEKTTAELTGVNDDIVKLVFNTAWDTICKELENGNIVKLHGKGRFYLSKRSARIGRNPLTGKEHDVPAREAMAFQTSPAFAKRLRERREALNQVSIE